MITWATTDARKSIRHTNGRPVVPTPASEPNVLSMLIEALTCSDKYEITERGGEIFVTPTAAG
jgi:hypothetical protein